MSKILVIAEVKNARVKTSTAELISKARSLGADTASLLVGNQLGEMESQLVKMGAQHQYICESPELENPSAQSLTRIIVEAAQQFQADQVWFSSNETAKATAPRVAARLSAGCVSDITDIADSGGVTVFRQAAAGKVLQKIQLKSPIGVFTVRSGAF
ncbi:MAG: electron transfer flavoprotein subunit alpha/FixB family protein, partial [Deltaproteobacteria bacterium]|nr:electron transfer flavoprotein subunit alpha/FixB family protein [Deltaproteobacteria bacterium]